MLTVNNEDNKIAAPTRLTAGGNKANKAKTSNSLTTDDNIPFRELKYILFLMYGAIDQAAETEKSIVDKNNRANSIFTSVCNSTGIDTNFSKKRTQKKPNRP